MKEFEKMMSVMEAGANQAEKEGEKVIDLDDLEDLEALKSVKAGETKDEVRNDDRKLEGREALDQAARNIFGKKK